MLADFCLVLLLVSACLAQGVGPGTTEIRKLRVVRSGDTIRVEIILTHPVNPKLTIATKPDRLVLDLPTTSANSRERRIVVNRNGVKQVRIGPNGANPPVMRAVVDVDTFHPYKLATAGNTVILIVLPADAAANVGSNGAGAQPSTGSTLWGKLRPRLSTANTTTKSKSSLPETTALLSDAKLHVSFKIKYVAEGAAYLVGGRSSGLAAGMTLFVHDVNPSSADSPNPQGAIVAELQIVSVAETSAVTEIRNVKRDVKPGDWAELSEADYAKLGDEPATDAALKNPLQPATPVQLSKTAQLEEALRAENQIRGRIAFDYSGVSSSGSTLGRSSSIGMAFHTDTTQIAGTHWNLQGDWRGRLTTNSQPDEETMQDYLDRAYTIQLFYDNPNSSWVAGVGRLYLPWAVSLDTIDGGYLGRKVASGVTAGVFLGSTPDQTDWHYRPDQQIAGSFVNFEGGNYDDFHYSSTTGFALSFLKWQLDRPYLFLENTLSYMKYISVYHSFIVDSPQGVSTDGITPGTGISRSYLSVLVQPEKWISFEVFHNYFRDVPTAATAFVGTGLVDKLLYQGLNVAVRLQPVRNFAVYTTIGQSDKTGDVQRSLNQMYGFTWNEIGHTGVRADVHYSKFDSSFARGDYRVLSLSRPLSKRMNWNTQAGSQTLDSAFTVNQHSVFLDSSFDTNLGGRTFLQSGYTIERGAQLNYEQWHLSFGYRFDMKGSIR
ncbi:MAG: AMIN domain-containing protein, partial [Terriglobales bacterium]